MSSKIGREWSVWCQLGWHDNQYYQFTMIYVFNDTYDIEFHYVHVIAISFSTALNWLLATTFRLKTHPLSSKRIYCLIKCPFNVYYRDKNGLS